MILTGNAIRLGVENGDITIHPYSDANVNPNSYNYHLFPELRVVGTEYDTEYSVRITPSGFLLQPGQLYLACTSEFFASTKYVMTLLGRSSIGRLGLFLNLSADLGHQGSASRWTLELKVVQPIIVYPNMKIGQVAFWHVAGKPQPYQGRYKSDDTPTTNKDKRLILNR